MATLTKMEMIKTLVETNNVDEFKKEKDDTFKLAGRLFRTLSADRVKELYEERIKISPEAVLEEVTEKIEKVATKSKTEKAEKVDSQYETAKDENGNSYKKAWVLEFLNSAGFSALRGINEIREIFGEKYYIRYYRSKNMMIAFSSETKKEVKRTLCLCPFIVKSFVKKYSV